MLLSYLYCIEICFISYIGFFILRRLLNFNILLTYYYVYIVIFDLNKLKHLYYEYYFK